MSKSGKIEEKIIGLLIVAILIGAVGGTAITSVQNISNSGMTATEATLVGILGVMVAIGLFVLLVRYIMGHED